MKSHANIFSDLLLRKLFLTGTLLVFLIPNTLAQSNLKLIGEALKQGNAQSLSEYFDANIDLTFSDKTTTYSKRQAQIIVHRFFSKVEPMNYTDVNSGGSHANNTKYSIGTLITSNGSYKVYMFFIQKNGVHVLRELRFEK